MRGFAPQAPGEPAAARAARTALPPCERDALTAEAARASPPDRGRPAESSAEDYNRLHQ
ncbi:hypothetical protein GCM10009602_65640 [Nocardiopsis tropica]